MAQSFVSYSATAAQTNFVVPFPFVAKANILVLVNGVQTAYTWLGATTVILAPTTAGDSVIVCRATDISSPAVTWTDPGTVTAGSLNLANLQELYALQEMTEANLLGATINAGWQPKTAVATASTANLVLSGEQIIDSVQTAISRVLVKDQTLSKDNGLYLTGPAAWTRTTDADTASKIGNALASVNGGTINGGSTWVCTLGATSITLGTTPLPFMKTGFQLGAAAPVAVLKGGTGASTATNARANLGI